MLKEQYINLKKTYEKYIILLKTGNFYISLNNDAIIMNNIFGYKINNVSNYIKIGFPLSSLNKITNKLDVLNINYIVFEKEIINIIKQKNNNYDNYISTNNYLLFSNRINRIYDILKNNINSKMINDILSDIENILCMINY